MNSFKKKRVILHRYYLSGLLVSLLYLVGYIVCFALFYNGNTSCKGNI